MQYKYKSSSCFEANSFPAINPFLMLKGVVPIHMALRGVSQ